MIYFEQGSGRELSGDVIAFRGTRDGERLHGFVTRETLEDMWAPAEPLLAERWLAMFDTLEGQVFALAEAKLRRGRMEPDGSVMIRVGDRESL